jgi:hypothetical protein
MYRFSKKSLTAYAVIAAGILAVGVAYFGNFGQKSDFRDFVGTYRGFTPVSGSAVGFGEIELEITSEMLKFRMATGNTILEKVVPTARYRLATPAEIARIESENRPDVLPVHAFFPTGNDPQLVFFDGV